MFEKFYPTIRLGTKKNHSQGLSPLIQTHLFKFKDLKKDEFIVEVEEFKLDTFVIKFYPFKTVH